MKKLKTEMGEITKARQDEEILFGKLPKLKTLEKRLQRLQHEYEKVQEESEDWYQKWLKVK